MPADWRERHKAVAAGRPARVEVHAYTGTELARAVSRGDALARGVVLLGRAPTR